MYLAMPAALEAAGHGRALLTGDTTFVSVSVSLCCLQQLSSVMTHFCSALSYYTVLICSFVLL